MTLFQILCPHPEASSGLDLHLCGSLEIYSRLPTSISYYKDFIHITDLLWPTYIKRPHGKIKDLRPKLTPQTDMA